MSGLHKSVLLFALNCLDAQLTLYWVRAGIATEGNRLMAVLLDLGDAPFMSVKILVGLAAALVLYRFSHLRVARRGLSLALGVYAMVMCIHALTGFAALEQIVPVNDLLALIHQPLISLMIW